MYGSSLPGVSMLAHQRAKAAGGGLAAHAYP